MIVAGCYTTGTDYERDADRLRASLDRFGIAHDIRAFESLGDWYANTAHKAEFLHGMRGEHEGGMLYLDVDAVVHEDIRPYFDALECDFAAHYFEGTRLLSGTMFFGDTSRARKLLYNWTRLNETLAEIGIREGGGQKNLWYLLTCMNNLRIERLPGRYCYVFDKAWAYPDEPRIIEHLIASRDHRAGTAEPHPGRAQRMRELDLELAL